MPMIDCYDRKACIESLSRCAGMSWEALRQIIRDRSAHLDPHDDPMKRYDPTLLGVEFGTYEVCWYHAARTWDPQAYQQGIKPLSDVLESIRTRIEFLIRKSGHSFSIDDALKDQTHPYARLYRMKVGDAAHHGPYGHLIRHRILTQAESGRHDYLKIPEIVEDILMCIKSAFGLDLSDLFSRETVKVVVRFRSTHDASYALKHALGYAFTGSLGCNTCCDNRGPVDKLDVLGVDVVP